MTAMHTNDGCSPAIGCTTNGVDCDDDNACTTDACNVASGCTHALVACDDHDTCTSDICEAELGCVYDDLCVDPLAGLSDDFEDASTLADWAMLSDVEGGGPFHDMIDIDTSVAGALVIDPNNFVDPTLPSGPTGSGWFDDYQGPLLFKEVTGDFVVVAHIQMGTTTNSNTAPTGDYNSGGFIVRAPAGAASGRGDEAWIMFNIGRQASFFGSETKTTFRANTVGGSSRSSLFLTPVSGNSGRLAMCRIGDHFYFFRNMDAAPGWVAEVHTTNNLVVNGAALPWANLESGFERPDIADSVQVGFIANRWGEGAAPPPAGGLRGRVLTTAYLADCTPD